MGKRGIAPKPVNLAILHGDRKDRINFDAPVPQEGVPQPPEDMIDEVRAVWDYTVEQLAAMNTLSMADRDTLVAYCEAVVTHRVASRAIHGAGLMIPGRKAGEPVRNPVFAMQRDAATLVRLLAREFGLTPSARSDITMGGKRDREPGGPERLLS